MPEEKWYTVDEIIDMTGKSRQTVLKWAKKNSLQGFESEKKGKSWYFRKIEGEAKATESKQEDKERIAVLEQKLRDEQEKHIGEINKLNEEHTKSLAKLGSENDETRRKLTEDRKKFEAWKEDETEKINKERENKLEEVRAREDAVAKREDGVGKKETEAEEAKAKYGELRKQCDEELRATQEEKERAVQLTAEARQTAEANIDNILSHLKGGTIGMMERAAWKLTQPTVARAFCHYQCPDCNKDGSDKINRVAIFAIPRLEELGEFHICKDCEQWANRSLPEYICDICPVSALMREAAELVAEALATAGVRPEYDVDGTYIMTSETGEEYRKLKPEEQIEMIMKKYGWGDEKLKARRREDTEEQM